MRCLSVRGAGMLASTIYMKHSFWGVMWVAGVFSLITVGTMLSVVLLAATGVKLVPLGKVERFSHALAGAAICMSGLAIQVLGL